MNPSFVKFTIIIKRHKVVLFKKKTENFVNNWNLTEFKVPLNFWKNLEKNWRIVFIKMPPIFF